MKSTVRCAVFLALLVCPSLAFANAPEGKATDQPPPPAVRQQGGWDIKKNQRPTRAPKRTGERRAAGPRDGEPEPFPVSNKSAQKQRSSSGKEVKKTGRRPGEDR